MSKRKTTALLILIFLSTGCYRKFYPVDLRMEMKSVTAYDLEEDGYWLSSGSDEVHIYYTLAALDKNNQVIPQPKNLHYGPEVFSRKGETHDGYAPMSVYVPARGKVYFGVQLVEDDDWSYISSFIDDLQTIVDVAKFFASDSKESRVASGVLKKASRILNWAGIAITVIDILDTNDQLMAFCMILDEDQLEALSGKSRFDTHHRTTGSNWGDYFDYRVDFALIAKQAYGEIEKVRLRSKAPNVLVEVSPFQIDQDLNDYWLRSPDRLLVQSPNNSSEYDFSDGFYNKNLSASLGVSLAPAFRLSKDHTGPFGKLYLQAGYRRLPYLLDLDKDITAGAHYLDNNSGQPSGLMVSPLELDLHQYRGGALLKLMGQYLSLDLGGGVLYHEGKTRFFDIQIANPDAQFIYDQNRQVLKKDYLPYGFAKLGIGRINGNNGFQLHLSAMAFQPLLRANEQLQLLIDPGNGIQEVVPVSAKDWRFNFGIGVSLYL